MNMNKRVEAHDCHCEEIVPWACTFPFDLPGVLLNLTAWLELISMSDTWRIWRGLP
jgi:hypothetical protein